MEFLDNVKEKTKTQGFALSVVTSALIFCASKFSDEDIKEFILFFTPQVAAGIVFGLLSIFSALSQWHSERKSKNNSMQSEALVKQNMEMLNIAKTNGIAGEEIANLTKVASQSVSAHMQMNLNRIAEINNNDVENINQKRNINQQVAESKRKLKEELNTKENE